jgi:uncharacterized membrane protein
MNEIYPQALFSTPGMVWVSWVVLILELLSIAYFVITIAEYGLLRRRHATFFREIGGEEAHREKVPNGIFWIYIVATIVMTLVTGILFILQPHLI